MLHVKKPTIQRLALRELYFALPQNNPNLNTLFSPLTPPPLLLPPALPTAVLILPINLIEDTSVLLAIDYTDQFHVSLNFFLQLNVKTN